MGPSAPYVHQDEQNGCQIRDLERLHEQSNTMTLLAHGRSTPACSSKRREGIPATWINYDPDILRPRW